MTCNYTTAADSSNDENKVEESCDQRVALPQPTTLYQSRGKEHKEKRPVISSDFESDDSEVRQKIARKQNKPHFDVSASNILLLKVTF